jgi:DNA-binding LytR/AlgR family response regulator
MIPLQNWIFKRLKKWSIAMEIGFLLLFSLIVFIGSFAYYKSDILNGLYSIKKFCLEVYYPTFFLLISLLIILRWFLFKYKIKVEEEKITIKGDNKLDILKIKFSELVCVSSADNYVEINYLVNRKLTKKLLRNTLKNIQLDVPSLVKVHRSYLINPSHFIEWLDSTEIKLTQMKVPVTRNYKKAIEAIVTYP